MQQGTLHPSSLSGPLLVLPWPAVPVCSSTRSQVIPTTSAANVTPPGMPKELLLQEALAQDGLKARARRGRGGDRLCSGNPSKGLPCRDRDAQQQAGPQRPQGTQGEVCTGVAAAREVLEAGSL